MGCKIAQNIGTTNSTELLDKHYKQVDLKIEWDEDLNKNAPRSDIFDLYYADSNETKKIWVLHNRYPNLGVAQKGAESLIGTKISSDNWE